MSDMHRSRNDGYVLVDREDKAETPDKEKMRIYRRRCFISNKFLAVAGILLTAWVLWLLWRNLRAKGVTFETHGHLVVLPRKLASEKGAYCLDGSPPGYYFRKGSDSGENSWIIHLQSGGWCTSLSDCYDRSQTPLGSSSQFPAQYEFDGILSNDKSVNPDFYNWNVAYFAYCDGASFAGNADEPIRYRDRDIYFRGRRILDLLLDYWMERGLSEADRVIFTGASAGGLGVFIHADYVRNKFPSSTDFHAFPDAGYFPDVNNITDFPYIRTQYRSIFSLHQVQGGLNKECLAAQDSDAKWKCFFPQYTYQFVQTPMFVLNSAYDYWTMWFALHLRCHPSQCDDRRLNDHYAFHRDFMQTAKQLYDSTKDGVYVSSCYAHTQAAFHKEWTEFLVNGTTPQTAFSDWYFERKSPADSKYQDCTTPGCNPSCDWSLEFYERVTTRLKRHHF